MKPSELRLRRLFNGGKAVVIAIDHGLFDGPIPGMENVDGLPEKIHGDVDAVLLSAGVLRRIGPAVFGNRGAAVPIVRINWSTIYCFTWDYHSGTTVEAFSPRDALRLGADTVLVSLSLASGSEARDAANVELFSRLCRDAHEYGMVVVGEYFPVDVAKLRAEQLHDEVRIGCRILCELAADVIKTYHTCNFGEVVSGCPIPILTLGGEKTAREIDALKAAQTQIADGAAGVVFGRNALQALDPIAFQKALIEVVRNGLEAEEAAAKYGIAQ